MADGEVSVIVNVFQLMRVTDKGCIKARIGCRVVEGSAQSIGGLTKKPVHFAVCTSCGEVNVHLGHVGGPMDYMCLTSDDPRAKLLTSIISTTDTENWGKPMTGPARVVGMIDVHQAATLSEIGEKCHCS